MAKPKLSIIIPTFNSEKTLRNTLHSVVNQQYNPIECLIIDGGSTDTTISIVQEFSDKHPFIRFVSEPDQGIYDAMNKGIDMASGDFLYFLGSDDLLYSDQTLLEIFNTPDIENTQFIYGNVVFKHSKIRLGEEKNYLKIIKSLENINQQAIFYHKSIFGKLGKYDLRFPIYADFNFNIKCFRDTTISTKYINKTICIFNEKGTSYSQRNKDRYIETVHADYVSEHEDAVALYNTVKHLENELASLYLSKDYLIGKRIGNTIRRMRSLIRSKEVNE